MPTMRTRIVDAFSGRRDGVKTAFSASHPKFLSRHEIVV